MVRVAAGSQMEMNHKEIILGGLGVKGPVLAI